MYQKSKQQGILQGDEKGSAGVLLVMILAGVIALAYVYIYSAQKTADRAAAESIYYLAGRSVLSEFDKPLKDEYGLIAYADEEGRTADKLDDYATYSFDGTRMATAPIYVDTEGYDLMDPAVFKREVVNYTEYALARDVMFDGGLGQGEGRSLTTDSTRTLRSQKVIQALPSGATTDKGSLVETVVDTLQHLDQVFQRGTERYLTDLYIMKHFKNAQQPYVGRDTFFEYETEYILMGQLSDKENWQGIRNELLLVRNAINLLFLAADPIKRAEIATAAAFLAPGPGALLMAGVLAEMWALAEAENDIQLLEHGKKVPVFKTKENWATDLDSILKGGATGYIDTGCETGLLYTDYLQVLLFVMDEQTKLLRTMDLIQINMQGNCDRSFLIQDHHTGFTMQTTIGGRKVRFGHAY